MPSTAGIVMNHSGGQPTVQLNGVDFDARCRIFRDLPRKYDEVLLGYVADEMGFREHVSENQLNQILDRRGLAFCRNDVFGFSFIAPRGNQLTTSVSQQPGVRVQILGEDSRIADIYVVLVSDFLEAAERSATTRLLDEGFSMGGHDRRVRYFEYQQLVSDVAFRSIGRELVAKIGQNQGNDTDIVSIDGFQPPAVNGGQVKAAETVIMNGERHEILIFVSNRIAAIIDLPGVERPEDSVAQEIIRYSFDLR